MNKDPVRVHRVVLGFRNTTGLDPISRQERLEVFQYSGTQYAWIAAGPRGYPVRSEAPRHFMLTGTSEVALPPFSLTVVRGLRPPAHG